MTDKKIYSKHDGFIKKVMESKIAARNFLDEYLPVEFKEELNLDKITVEKDSFIEEDLQKKFSDVVFSVGTKDGGEAFVYTILEHQVSSDYWIAYRLLKYSMLLLERHIDKGKNKLPLICPIVLYNGKSKYSAPLNFWELFTNPEKAKKLMGDNYKLIDIQAMSDEEILKKGHIAIFEYLLKHIHMRDKIKLFEDVLENCKKAIIIDTESGYVYLKPALSYIDTKIVEEKKPELEHLLISRLDGGNEIMRTIAQSYIDEGMNQEKIEIAKAMLSEGVSVDTISKFTKLLPMEILKLKKK